MARADRIQDLVSFLRTNETATLSELSERFEVSTMTIRRDISVLEKRDMVRVFRGGVLWKDGSERRINRDASEYSLLTAESKHHNEKLRIGKKAAELVQPNDIIIIGSGTTAECIARALPTDVPLSVLCYTLNTLTLIARMKNVDVVLAGGRYHDQAMMFESPEGIQLINHNRATKAFISAAGVHPKLGLTSLPYETLTKQAVLRSSLTNILVADASKFGVVYPAHYADLSDIDIVITDSGTDARYVEDIERLGITVLIA